MADEINEAERDTAADLVQQREDADTEPAEGGVHKKDRAKVADEYFVKFANIKVCCVSVWCSFELQSLFVVRCRSVCGQLFLETSRVQFKNAASVQFGAVAQARCFGEQKRRKNFCVRLAWANQLW